MTNETLYRAMGDISETYIAEARAFRKTQKHRWIKWGGIAAALCLVLGAALLSNILGIGGGPFGNGDSTVFAIHREDFTPDIESSILSQFEDPSEVKKAYLMRTNEWFLSDELTDFSQAVTTDTVYVVPGGENPSDPDAAFSIYDVDEDGNIQWDCTAYPPANASVPFEFSGLTYEVIHHALSGIEHEDYIITYAPTLGIVFIWARGTAEDTILAYPTRPDLLGMENGGFYTLDEVQTALSNAYHSCGSEVTTAGHSHENTHHTDNHHTQHTTSRSFVSSMGCNDPNCSYSTHFHNCDESCDDPAHYHSCDADCTAESHNHPGSHHAENSSSQHFTNSMGCSDKYCTDSSHFHNCSDDCDDPAHYHSCDSDCNIKEHNHPREHHKDHH